MWGEERVLADFSTARESASGPAADLWRRTLAQVRTQFGRLVYVARLRNPETGQYYYRTLADAVGSELTDRILASSHRKIFSEWIGLTLARQKSDLDEYLRESGEHPDAATFRDLLPASAHDVERQLYLTDLETLMVLLRFERGAGASAPEASPPPRPGR